MIIKPIFYTAPPICPPERSGYSTKAFGSFLWGYFADIDWLSPVEIVKPQAPDFVIWGECHPRAKSK